MADRFSDAGLYGAGLSAPLTVVQRSTHSAADITLTNTSRCLIVDIDGTLKVDTHGGDTNVAILVVAGYNPIRITKIYKTGSDVIVVDCWD